MQTRNFGLRGIALAVAGVMTLGLAACDDTDSVPPVQPVGITISPTGTVELNPGESFQIAATATNATGAVTYSTSDATVADVDQTGRVTAEGPGFATIIATAPGAGNTQAQASVGVRVLPDTEVPTGEAEVIIEGVFNETGTQTVDPDNVEGRIVVRMEVDRGDADELVVMLRGENVDEVVCRQTFTSGDAAEGAAAAAAQATLLCPINTARFEIVNGQVQITYMNGPAEIIAELRRDGEVLDRATTGALTLANEDQVVIRTDVENPREGFPDWTQNPQTNRIWAGGDVIVTAIPVMFSGAAVQDAVIGLQVSDDENVAGTRTVFQAAELDGGVFQVVFPADETMANGGVADVEANLVIPFVGQLDIFGNVLSPTGQEIQLMHVWDPADFQRVSNVTVAGQTFDAGWFRLDNVGPEIGTFDVLPFSMNGYQAVARFINEEFAFTAANARLFPTAADRPVDDGVNAVTNTFFAGTGTTAAQIVTSENVIEMGDDLDNSLNQTAYRAAVRAVDALGNATVALTANRFGVDTIDPEIRYTASSAGHQEVFVSDAEAAGEQFVVQAVDTTSAAGFATNPYFARVVRITPAGTQCGPTVLTTNGNEDLPGATNAAGACVFTNDNNSAGIPFPSDADGYYTYEAFAVDQAGNRSDTLSTRMILSDDEAPTIRNIVLPSAFTAGADANLVFDAEDNVDLWQFQYMQRFGAEQLPFEAAELIDPRFDGTPVGEARDTARANYIRTYTHYVPGSSDLEAYTCVEPDGVGIRLWDATNHWVTEDFRTITPAAVTNCFANTDAVTEWSIEVDDTSPDVSAGESVTLTAVLRGSGPGGAADFDSPFANGRVAFYVVDGGQVYLIGNATGVETIDENATTRRVEYTLEWTPGATRTFEVFAVGITPASDALRTSDSELVTPVP